MIRFYNGKYLTLAGGAQVHDGEVWTDGRVISRVGAKKADMPAFDREIDLGGDLVMPSFKNAHTHSAMTFLRSYADDLPLNDWLFKQVFPMEARLTDDIIYTMTRLAILEYLSGGITASFDMYYRNDAYAKANIDSGFRTVICSALNDLDADETNIEREYIKFNGLHELVSYRLGIHGEYTTGMPRLQYMADLVHKYKAPFYSHNSETKSEVAGCLGRHGKTPTELFESLGLYDFGGGGYHCTWMSERDLEIFKRRGLYAVTNPASNLKLASGVAPIEKMLQMGIKLAIGTDGAASNNALDMFREMYLATALQKLTTENAAACPAEKVLEMACSAGAGAMGLHDCDDLAPGKKADLIVIDLNKPNMRPKNNIIKNLVYAGSRENVRLTMINGEIKYENGQYFIGQSPEEIYSAAEEIMRALKNETN